MAQSHPTRKAWAVLSELSGAIVLASISLITLLFVWIGAEVGEGQTKRFDSRVLLALRQPGDLAQPIGPHWLKSAMVDLTALGGVTVLTLTTLLAIGSLLVQRKRAHALLIGIAVGGGAVLSALLKMGYARPRPTIVAHLVEVTSSSFPSGHAMNSAVTYLTLGALLARAVPDHRLKVYLLWVGVLLTMLVGISRVFLGVHWPTDVMAGWAVGSAWAGLCWFAAERLNAQHQRTRVRQSAGASVQGRMKSWPERNSCSNL